MGKFRFELYDALQKNGEKILGEMAKVPEQIGMPGEYKGKIALSGGSGNPPLVLKQVGEAMEKAGRTLSPVANLDVETRRLVKSFYGDEYDGAIVNTCEAALYVSYEVMLSPPFTGRGEAYRARYISPYERHMHHQAGYGRPYPPRYKDLTADRGTTAGELGVYAKRLFNVDNVVVPLEGADYTCHGIKYHPCTLMLNTDAQGSVANLRKASDTHAEYLAGYASMGYDTPGYGYGEKDKSGAPLLQRLIGDLAGEYGVPYLSDNARGTPFIGTDIRDVHADIMVFSTDKAFPGPTAGLMVGKEDIMVPIRRALGIHGSRWGTGSSHGKAGYVACDPGKEVMAGLLTVLRLLREEPEKFTRVVDRIHEIVLEEIKQINPAIASGLQVYKSYNALGVEINYENTWKSEEGRVPIFSIEDMYAGTAIIQTGLARMGVGPTLGYDANMILSPNSGTTDENGELMEEPMRYAIKCILKAIEILHDNFGK